MLTLNLNFAQRKSEEKQRTREWSDTATRGYEVCRFVVAQTSVSDFNRQGHKLKFVGLAERSAMKSHTKHLTFNIPGRMGFINITPQVAAELANSGISEGLCLINAMHITASVFINDDEPGLHEDYKRWLEWLAPFDPSPERYHHNRTGEDNGDAHHKRQIMGREVVVAVTNGKLDCGPWEQIFYGEFDGRRNKRVMVKIIGE